MSDIDNNSDTERPTKANKLELEQSQNDKNMFSFRERSHSASDADDPAEHEKSDQENNETGERKASKLSDMLGADEVREGTEGRASLERRSQSSERDEIIKPDEVTEVKQQEQLKKEVEEKGQKKEQKKVEVDKNKTETLLQQQKLTQKEKEPQQKMQIQSQTIKQAKKEQKILDEPIIKAEEAPKIVQQQLKIDQQQISVKVQQPVQVTQEETKNKIKEQKLEQKPKINVDPKVQQAKRLQLELQYNKQLQDELAALKKNANKKKKSQKQSETSKLNKTVMPKTTHKQLEFDQTPETKAMEMKMITTMAQEKKKQNYNRLREWDKRRAEALAVHRNMIELLQTEIDKRIKSSIQNLEIYTTFLREKARQQQKYVSHPVINTKYALQNNSISKNVYINCTVILNSLSDENNARCRKINDFIHLIRNDILRDSIEAHLTQSQKQLLKVREKISSLKAALRKQNAETEEKTSQLALFFNENSVNMNVEGDRDFFSTQLQFLQKASQQTHIQKKLGEHCLEYLHTAINEQIKRSKVIRQAMITFSKALEQCYSIDTDPAEIQQLSKSQETKLIQQFYSLQEIFDERCLAVFKTYENIPNEKMLTVQMFSNFLKKFQFEGFDSRVILLKQFNVRYHPSGKNETNTEQNCYVVITVDKWIHLFLSKEKTDAYTKPDVSIRVSMKNLSLKPIKTEMLDLTIKDQKRNSMISYFWESKSDRVYRLQFPKKDSREEFIDYVAKLRG